MLFTDPRKWTQDAVGSWWRFALIAIANTAFIVYAVYVSADSGFRSGLAAAVMPVVFQLLFLYALRGMHLQAVGTEAEKRAV